MILQLNPVLLLEAKGRGRALATLAIQGVGDELKFLCILEDTGLLEIIAISELTGKLDHEPWLRRN